MKALKTIVSLILTTTLLCTSCVDADLGEVVDTKNHYKNVNDADAAILGLYGKVMDLAGQVVVLNELRGDLMDVTNKATPDLQEINLHKPSKSNSWTNIYKFYSVIQNCNDILYNYEIMLKNNRMTDDEYKERYSDVGAVRTWVYLQLGIHFGKVPYIVDPIIEINDIDKYIDKELTLDQLLPELIKYMLTLPTLNDYQNSGFVNGHLLDGYNLKPFFINKQCLLGDLYLYNNNYAEAALAYRSVLATDENIDIALNNRKYRLYTWVWTSGEPNWFQILYVRYKDDDILSLKNAWKSMFSLPADNRYVADEMIWQMSYDYRYSPSYPFVELFANAGKGKYYLKPSQYAVDEVWGGETQKNGFPFDARGLDGGFEKASNGDYVITKYKGDYDPINKPFEQSGKWFLYRAAMLNLRFAEAANRAGYPRLAWALVNDGVRGAAFNWKPNDGRTEFRKDSISQSGPGPGQIYPYPYGFDARNSDQPYLRSPWRDGGGVRGRASLPNVDMSHITTKQDSIEFIEKMIIRESGLELGFEGHRWGDLLRIARRMEKENAGTGAKFLDDNMKKKYEKSGIPKPDLSSPDKWYLPLYK